MEQERRAEALKKIKKLLGLTGGDKDELLFYLIDDTERLICGYCRRCHFPRALEGVMFDIIKDRYRASGYGAETAPEVVKSVTEGNRSVSFADTTPGADYLKNYYGILDKFMCRRGRVPSDVGKVCGCV